MMRLLSGLFLALALSLTSVTAAVARAEMAGATELVVCSGMGMASVTLDASGNPVSAHHCPVCTAAGFAVDTALQPATLRPATRAEALAVLSALTIVRGGILQPSARGPPVAV